MKRAENRSPRLFALLSAHAAIILSLIYLTLFVIDRINTAMEFINNDITKTLVAILAVLAIANGIAFEADRRKKAKSGPAKKAALKKAAGATAKKAK